MAELKLEGSFQALRIYTPLRASVNGLCFDRRSDRRSAIISRLTGG
jgi:hypothetical protein